MEINKDKLFTMKEDYLTLHLRPLTKIERNELRIKGTFMFV